MSLADDAARLDALAANVPTLHLRQLAGEVERIGGIVQQVLGNDGDVLPLISQTLHAISEADATLAAVQQTIRSVAARHAGHPQPAPTSKAPAHEPAAAPKTVTAPDGSNYPQEAAWCADLMPKRVEKGTGQRTIGYADGNFNQFTSGTDSTYTPAARDRLLRAGIHPAAATFLSRHVEIKAATDLIMQGKTQSELVINNVPCTEISPTRPGCAEALPKYLPRGTSLTVHGTDRQGRPFSHTYEGENDRDRLA
ncbi:DddA-like double-stranded DNA deaminase toxin [Amycolatopsis jejuensis]|uniref:DddA-like double-stranded DNA deaminase toxin n=1 Tax=Amycolatopsis jejuensis TaxID=330084 RepID=UPI0005245FB5|nr:DddA-like double-stranded DNA deaminase toxin [Amycolatopsis jejuensis]